MLDFINWRRIVLGGLTIFFMARKIRNEMARRPYGWGNVIGLVLAFIAIGITENE